MRQAEQAEDAMPRRGANIGKFAAVILKLTVTAVCFWYVARQIDLVALARILPTIKLGWVALAVLIATLQVPLIGLRWSVVLDALPGIKVSRMDAIAIT